MRTLIRRLYYFKEKYQIIISKRVELAKQTQSHLGPCPLETG